MFPCPGLSALAMPVLRLELLLNFSHLLLFPSRPFLQALGTCVAWGLPS